MLAMPLRTNVNDNDSKDTQCIFMFISHSITYDKTILVGNKRECVVC